MNTKNKKCDEIRSTKFSQMVKHEAIDFQMNNIKI